MISLTYTSLGTGIPTGDELRRFEGLLAGLKNTDLFIMLDVTEPATHFVEKLKNISSEAVICMKRFNGDGNSVALMQFSSQPKLIIGFDDPCFLDDKCLQKKGRDVRYTRGWNNYFFNPLTAFDEYTRYGNLIFSLSWTSRSSATHAPGSGLISTDALSSKIANFIKYRWQLTL